MEDNLQDVNASLIKTVKSLAIPHCNPFARVAVFSNFRKGLNSGASLTIFKCSNKQVGAPSASAGNCLGPAMDAKTMTQ